MVDDAVEYASDLPGDVRLSAYRMIKDAMRAVRKKNREAPLMPCGGSSIMLSPSNLHQFYEATRQALREKRDAGSGEREEREEREEKRKKKKGKKKRK